MNVRSDKTNLRPPNGRQAKRKQRREKRKQQLKAKAKKKKEMRMPRTVDQTAKQRMQDPRNSAVTTSSIIGAKLSTQVSTVVIESVVDANTLIGLAMGYLSVANQRGYAAQADDPSYPYWSCAYAVGVLASACSASAPLAIKVPTWMAIVLNALMPKTVPNRQGLATYRFVVEGALVPPINGIVFGPPAYALGSPFTVPTPGTTISDGFPVAVNPAAYTDANGVLAWASLMNFMEWDTARTKNDANKIVVWSSVARGLKDVSAFAPNFSNIGGGLDGLGGFGATAQLEVPVFTPLLANFIEQSVPNPLSNRYPNFLANVAGDPVFLGAAASSFYKLDEWATQNPPKIHCVDFLEFVEVMCFYIQSLIEQWGADQSNNPEVIDGVNLNLDLTCPLSLQEFQYILRNTMMCAFRDTQPAVQSLYPVTPATNSDNQFVAFQAAAPSCALQDTGMILPIPLIENIRALSGRRVGNGNKVSHYVPCLGMYYNDELDAIDYQVGLTLGGVDYTYPPFAAAPQLPLQDANASLVNAFSSSVNDYVQINDPERLGSLTSIWNRYIQNWPATYSVPTGVLGNELGINAVCSINVTRHWFPLSSSARLTDHVKKVTVVDSKGTHVERAPKDLPVLKKELSKKMLDDKIYRGDPRMAAYVAPSSPYSFRTYAVTTSQSAILAAPFNQVQNVWILPVNNALGSTTSTGETFYTRYQELMQEPFSAIATSGNDGISLGEMHGRYANQMTHNRTAPESTWIQFFNEMAALGRGGILSGLVNSFLGPGAGDAVAGVLGALI